MASELGVAYISIVPSTKGMSKSIAQDLKKLDPLAQQAGKRMGDTMSEGIGQGFQGAEQGAEKAAQGTVTAFSGVGQRIKAGLSGDFKSAFAGVEGDAASSANEVASEFSAAGGEAADGFSSKLMDGLKGLGGLAGVAGIGASLAAGIVGGMEREKLGGKLAAQLNLTGVDAQRAGDVAGKLYAGAWGESMDETHDAVATVMSSIPGMMDAPTEALEGVTVKAMDLATAFDVDINEAVGAVGVMMRNGLATDADQAFDLMIGSLQKVPAGFRDELFPAITEYGKHFAGLGIDGATAMGLLVKGAENGTIGVDKMGDAIKEFQIRSTDMSKATSEAYGVIGLDMEEMTNALLAGGDTAEGAFAQIVHGLQGIDDPAAQSAAAIALFGTPLEDLSVNELPNFLGAIDPAGDAFDTFEGAAKRMGDTLNNNTATAFESLKRGISTGFVDLVGGAAVAMTNMWRAVEPFARQVAPFAAGIGIVAGAYAAWTVATRIQTAALWGQAAAFIAANAPMVAIVAGLGLLVGAVIHAYKNVGWFRDMVNGAWTRIKQWTAALVTWWTTTAFPALAKAVAFIAGRISWLYQDVVKPVWGWIKSAIAGVVAWFVGTVVPNFQGAVKRLGGFFNFLYRNFIAPFVWLFKMAIGGARSWFAKTIVPAFQKALDTLGRAFRWLYEKVIRPVWTWIRDKINAFMGWFNGKRLELQARLRFLGDRFRELYTAYVRPAFDWIRDKLTSAWGVIRDRVFAPMRDGLARLQDAFTRAKNGIGTAWDKLKAKVKEPIAFVVNKVINPFIGGYNKLNNFWSGDDLNKIEGFHTGGYTGPGSKYTPAGVVHADEYVIRKESQNDLRRNAPGLLDSLNKYGSKALGYATGGLVKDEEKERRAARSLMGGSKHWWEASPSPLPGDPAYFSGPWWDQLQKHKRMNVSKATKAAGPFQAVDNRWQVESATRAWDGAAGISVKMGGTNPYTYITQGETKPDGSTGPWWGWSSGSTIMLKGSVLAQNPPADLLRAVTIHELGHSLGLDHVSNRQSVMHPSLANAKTPTTQDIRALQRLYPGGSGKAGDVGSAGGLGSWVVDKLRALVAKPLSAAKSMFSGNKFAQMPLGIAGKLVDGVIGKASAIAGIGGEPAGEGVERWRGTVREALKIAGLPTSNNYVEAWLRQIQSESGGNPRAVQGNIGDINNLTGDIGKGLVQVIGSTFRDYRDPELPNDRFNPLANLVAGMRWSKSRYGIENMLSVIGHGHGYANGGLVKPGNVWDDPVGTVHKLPQGHSTIYNGTGGAEFFQRVDPSSPQGGLVIQGDVYTVDETQFANKVFRKMDQRRSLAYVA